MDDNRGNFKPITEEEFRERMHMQDPINFPIKNTYPDRDFPSGPQVFKVGEILEIRGSRLRIEKILKHKLILRLLPQLNKPEEGK